jgi:O-antigen/teichoic acid export membrane protein
MDNKNLIPLMRKFTPFILILFSIVSIILILIIPYAILLLFSSKYANSIIYAQIYTLTVPLSFLLSITTLIMIAKNLENALLKFRVIGVLIILGLYFLLIPTYGLMGAIISSIFYFLIINIIQYSYLVHKNKNESI